MARMPTGRADQCPQLGIERTKRGRRPLGRSRGVNAFATAFSQGLPGFDRVAESQFSAELAAQSAGNAKIQKFAAG
jgi:hypothetical protein